MGSKYLTDLADVCRRVGINVIEVGSGPNQTGDAWKQRSRSSGGYESGRPNHIMIHHTASNASSDGWPDVNFMLFSSSNSNKPTCNLYLSRVPEIYVCAGGATNTNGSGHDMCGITPDDSMNSHAIGIEAGNDGVGEVWPVPMLQAYNRLCWELSQAYGIPVEQIHAHWQWAPTRKIDPAGPDSYQEPPRDGPAPLSWNMGVFCDDVRAAGGQQPPQPQPPEPIPPQPQPPQEDWITRTMNAMPTLTKGASGIPVKKMQHLLAAVGFMNPANVSNYDGQFGSGTENALNSFKLSAGGPANGRCDSWTWGALMHTIDGIPTLNKGDRGLDVTRMQHLLAALGYMNEANVKNYDGVWGDGTDKAKARMDSDYGLGTTDTECGPKSWESLLSGRVW